MMIEISRSLGAPAKFSGSGSAVIGMSEEEQYRRLMKAYLNEGYTFAKVEPQRADVERARSEQKEVPTK